MRYFIFNYIHVFVLAFFFFPFLFSFYLKPRESERQIQREAFPLLVYSADTRRSPELSPIAHTGFGAPSVCVITYCLPGCAWEEK